VTSLLPKRIRIRALLGTATAIIDLAAPVDLRRDHVRGPKAAPVTVVEYGDFECPFCGLAEPAIRELLAGFGDVRYVWRHLPLTDVHPHAQLAAEAAEAAAAQGAFWEMHDMLLRHQDALRPADLVGYAATLDLDVERFARDLRKHAYTSRVAEDVDTADLGSVSGTPTFFVNGQRRHGAYDIDSLSQAGAPPGRSLRLRPDQATDGPAGQAHGPGGTPARTGSATESRQCVTSGYLWARACGIEDRLPPVVLRNEANAGGRL